jgi:hypothetical protein
MAIMTDTEANEDAAYERGRRAGVLLVLQQCLLDLGRPVSNDPSDLQVVAGQLIAEREEALALLRQVCAEYGDNDWPDDLNLSDVIKKHLWRHLQEQ